MVENDVTVSPLLHGNRDSNMPQLWATTSGFYYPYRSNEVPQLLADSDYIPNVPLVLATANDRAPGSSFSRRVMLT